MPMMHQPEPEPQPVAPPPPPPRSAPVVAPVAAAAPVPAHAVPTFGHEEPAKKAPIVPIAIGAVVVLAAVGGWFAMRGGKSAAPATSTTAPAPIAAPAGAVTTAATASTATTTTGSALAVPPALGTQAPALDPALINEEVKKRLAAERAKLDQQQRAQQTQTTAPARPVVPTATQAAAPQPVIPAPAPAPQPVAPAPQPVAEAPRPAPAPVPQAEPAAERAQTGDLVPSGTPGLTAPRITRQAPASYPPMAKAQRIEGTVVMSVLVSESGQVLQTRILSGVPRGGINEAAEQSIRRSTFSPGTKDGAKVKSWTTVRIDFKL